MYYIDSAYVIGNAFTIYLAKTGKRVLSLAKLKDYGNAIVKDFEKEKIKSCLLFDSDDIVDFLDDNPSFFSYNKEEDSIILNETITKNDLFDKFAGKLKINDFCIFNNNLNTLIS